MQSAVNARTVRGFREIWGKFIKERFSNSYQPSEVVLPADAQKFLNCRVMKVEEPIGERLLSTCAHDVLRSTVESHEDGSLI